MDDDLIVVGCVFGVVMAVVLLGLIIHQVGLCGCDKHEVETVAVASVDSIEENRPDFLPLTDIEIQRNKKE